MIATVTLNPAVDKTLTTSRIVMGSINRADKADNFAGGKGINVTRVLKSYGYDVKALGFVGGFQGEFIADSVKKMGATEAFTQIEGQTRTSVNIISDDGYVTEFLEPGPVIRPEEEKEFLESFEKTVKECDMVIISGSLPKGVDPDLYARMIAICNDNGVRALLDTSGPALKKGMYERPFMMKPNLKELEEVSGKKVKGLSEVARAASEIVEWGVRHVMVSMGSKGILYACSLSDLDDVKIYYVNAPRIQTVNTVGSGDCAVAAFAMALSEGLSPEDTVKKCVAVSCANAMTLKNAEIDPLKVEEIFDSLKLTPVKDE